MDRRIRRRWVASIGIAIAMALAGCGSGHAPGIDAPPSNTPVADDTYQEFADTLEPFICSTVYQDKEEAAYDLRVPQMRQNAVKYRDMVSAWDGKLAKIEFPSAAQPIVEKIHELNASEMNALDAVAAVVEEDYTTLDNFVDAAESAVRVEVDRLKAALGHPVPPARFAEDQLAAAFDTFYTDDYWTAPLFDAALAHNDLDAAKAANVGQENALSRYIDRLDRIAWPEGFEGEVKDLQDGLRKVIEWDRHQVDVATAAEVVKGAAGDHLVDDAINAEPALIDRLSAKADESDPPLKC